MKEVQQSCEREIFSSSTEHLLDMARTVDNNHRSIVNDRRLVRSLVGNANVVVAEFQERGTPHEHSIAIAYLSSYTTRSPQPAETESIARIIPPLLEQRDDEEDE